MTRARQTSTAGPPELAIQEMLTFLGKTDRDLRLLAVVREQGETPWWRAWPAGTGRSKLEIIEVDAHRAHADYAFRSSGFDEALVVVCDAAGLEGYTAWMYRADGSGQVRIQQAQPVGHFPITLIYSAATEACGLQAARDEHQVEAMARAGDPGTSRIADLITLSREGVSVRDDFQKAISENCGGSESASRRRDIAAAVQQKLGVSLNELLSRLAKQSGAPRVCLSGGLFFNTHFTTTAAQSGAFKETYIPPHPGRNGSALGAAIFASATSELSSGSRASNSMKYASPYLGPGYSDPQVKEALENCKIAFDLQRENQVIETVLHALSRGRLVGWFHGRLEWGPRALGHRTVLADPFSPHVLENLNGYLKKRPAYRTYGVSVPVSRLQEFFEGPPASPFMQYEYKPRDPEKFRALLPDGVKTLRVHTVDENEPRYLRLLEQWGEVSGTPVLVNTSFNGFHEPLVCSPRDAIRVFYGTGLDLLALEDFIVRK